MEVNMSNDIIITKLAIGVIATFIIIGLLFVVCKKRKVVKESEKIFGDIFFRTLLMLFPTIVIAKNIYEFIIIIAGIVFATLLNTQYFTKAKALGV